MLSGTNSQKVAKPLLRPNSNSQKSKLDAIEHSKMQVLAPETNGGTNFAKPNFQPKKEMKLERTGSSASKKSTTSTAAISEVSSFDVLGKDPSGLSFKGFTTTASPAIDTKAQEDLRKVSSKPFTIKSSKAKRGTLTQVETSADHSARYSSQSTNLDQSNPRLTTPGELSIHERSQGMLSNSVPDVDIDDLTDGMTHGMSARTVDDILMFDDDEEEQEEEEELSVDFAAVQKKFEEIAKIQSERAAAARAYVAHVSEAVSDDGHRLVTFPGNYEEIVKSAVEEAKTMEDLKEKGLVSNNELERFIRESISNSLQHEREGQESLRESVRGGGKAKGNEEEEDKYAKEKAKIRELDRILAEKERAYRAKKQMDKEKRLEHLERLSESDISTDNIDRIFLTDWNKKGKRSVQPSMSVSTAVGTTPSRETKDQSVASKAKPTSTVAGNIIKRNIDAAFSKTKNSIATKLTPEDQERLDQLMAVINAQLDDPNGAESEEAYLSRAVPNPYANGAEFERLKEIERIMAGYSLEEGLSKTLEPAVDEAKLPKDKALREVAERRALQEKNDAITKKLMAINDKERLNEVYDSNVILALVEKLKQEHGEVPPDSARIRENKRNEDELERQLREVEANLASFNTDEMIADLQALSDKAQLVKQNIRRANDDTAVRSKVREIRAQRERQQTELLDTYSTRKIELEQLDIETDNMGRLAEIEKRLLALERQAIESENKVWEEQKNIDNTASESVNTEDNAFLTTDDYDKKFTELLKASKPELFIEKTDEEESNGEPKVEIYKLENEQEREYVKEDSLEGGKGLVKGTIDEKENEDEGEEN